MVHANVNETLICCIQLINKLKKDSEARGEEYEYPKMRRNVEMDEYDLMHWRRSLEEREALIRDIGWYALSLLNNTQ